MNRSAMPNRSAKMLPPLRTAGARPHGRQATAGFTLLELLVSITIVSLLATTILFGWRVASAAWQRANDRLQQQRTVLATHQLLQEQMASMVPYQARTAAGASEFFFQGEAATARFVSRYALSHRARSGLYLIEYRIAEQSDGSKQLLLNESPVGSREELGALLAGAEMIAAGRVLKFQEFHQRPETLALLEGLQECRFEYYRPATASQPPGWTDRWVSVNNELPRGMAIHAVAPAEATGPRPVAIVAAVQHYARGRNEGEQIRVRRSR